ncbi:MAG: vWA domain-containing protein [Planctomycetota bacterium]|jgi:Ca-activated chloride channel family protein
MKVHKHNMLLMLLLAVLSATGFAKTVEVSVLADKPVVLDNGVQTVYLRVGLTGCEPKILSERVPVNVAIVIDKSGSMSGEKIQKAKEAAILAVHRLKSTDIVSVVLYDSDVQVLVPATKLTKKEQIIRQIRTVNAGGSTALYAGVQNGADEVRKFIAANKVNRIVLLSDGLANVGPQSPNELGRLGANLVEEGISVTTIGLGLGYNEDLMSQLAYKSDGGHYFAEHADELAGVFDDEFGRATSVVAQDVTIEIICGEGMRPVRILGREGTIKDRIVKLDIQSIYGSHEKYVIVEVELPADIRRTMNGKNGRQLADVRFRYRDMTADKHVSDADNFTIRFTGSNDEVDKNRNKAILADAVEQIAIENNERWPCGMRERPKKPRKFSG